MVGKGGRAVAAESREDAGAGLHLDSTPPMQPSSSKMQATNSKRRGSNANANAKQPPSPSAASHLFGRTAEDQTLETTMAMHLWYPNQTPASTSTLSKAPLLREVPQMKRMLTSRMERDNTSDSRPFQSLKSATPSWLREKPSRQKLNSTPQKTSLQARGTWKKVTATCRDNGVLLIYGEDRALVYSVPLKDLSASDIRLVDDSLFLYPNILGIFSRPSTLHLGTRSPINGIRDRAPSLSKRQPIYLCFPTGQKLKKWRGLLRTFAKPEIYGPASKGGTHRCHRQVDMKVLEAKISEERRLVVSPSVGAFGTSLDDSDVVDAPAPALGLVTSAGDLIRQGTDESLNRQTSKSAPESTFLNGESLAASKDETIKTKQVEEVIDTEDDDNNVGMTSGPISGLSGKDRISENKAPANIVPSYEMERKISDGPPIVAPCCYCLIWIAGELVAQTKTCTSTFKTMSWFDKFSLKDLPSLTCMQIDVMQQSGRSGKSGVLGTVNLPIETMRRGERIEGWFPIWSSRARDSETASSSAGEGPYTDEMVGEIKLEINVAEETVLPLKKYQAVEEALTSDNNIDLIKSLCKHLDEDHVISHLVDIYASKGAIVEQLMELTEAESVHFDDNPALLFRSNTLLTRAIDKYQRLHCRDWLDGCIGLTVRRVCQNQIGLEASDSPHHYAYPVAVQESSTTTTVISVESNLDALLRLCKDLWANIYRNRQRCPPDLRRVLCHIRNKVNSRFPQSDAKAGPGIQGVGAFVFLRLICPAITTPHLYGLMGSSPSASSSKTLMLIAKVFLALANKRVTFDKDKEPWLGQANDFLTVHAPAYDDFITFVSTEPPGNENTKQSLGDEADYSFQRLIKTMSKGLPVLHRESLPSQDYMLDRGLALAGLVSFVVREASIEMPAEGQHGNIDKERESLERYQKFVDLCCDVEDKTGIYLDRAGYNPEPIDFSRGSGADGTLGIPMTQVYTSTTLNTPSSGYSDLPHSLRSRRATVSGVGVKSVDGKRSQTSSISSSAKDARPQDRLPMIFASHVKPIVEPSRQTLEYEEEKKGLFQGRLVKGRSSIEVTGKLKVINGDGAECGVGDHSDVKIPGTPSSPRKVKRSWWKRL